MSRLLRVRSMGSHLRTRLTRHRRDSVFFFTFHKCASSLFGGYVLPNAEGLHHVDFASRIYSGKHVARVAYEPKGHVYGPLRLSATGRMFEQVVAPAIHPAFIRDKTAIILVRDPRDILVSAFYSFGTSHGFSVVPGIRDAQVRQREQITALNVDQYALLQAPAVRAHFETAAALSALCPRSVVVRYEDMITSFDTFKDQLAGVLTLGPTVVQQLYERSRPREGVDITSHRRSGRPGGFRSALAAATIRDLNGSLGSVLRTFGYER